MEEGGWNSRPFPPRPHPNQQAPSSHSLLGREVWKQAWALWGAMSAGSVWASVKSGLPPAQAGQFLLAAHHAQALPSGGHSLWILMTSMAWAGLGESGARAVGAISGGLIGMLLFLAARLFTGANWSAWVVVLFYLQAQNSGWEGSGSWGDAWLTHQASALLALAWGVWLLHAQEAPSPRGKVPWWRRGRRSMALAHGVIALTAGSAMVLVGVWAPFVLWWVSTQSTSRTNLVHSLLMPMVWLPLVAPALLTLWQITMNSPGEPSVLRDWIHAAWAWPSLGPSSWVGWDQAGAWAYQPTAWNTLCQALGGGRAWMAPITIFLCLVGVWSSWKQESAKRVWARSTTCLGLQAVCYTSLAWLVYGIPSSPAQWRILLPPLLALFALFLARGIQSLLQRWPSGPRTILIQGLLLIMVLSVCLYPPVALRGDRQVEEYGRQVLQSLPSQSVLLVSDEECGHVLAYLHVLGSVRPDVQVWTIERDGGEWVMQEVTKGSQPAPRPLDDYLTLNLGRFSIFLLGPWPDHPGPPISLVPYGLVRLVTSPASASLHYDQHVKQGQALLQERRWSGEGWAALREGEALLHLARYQYEHGQQAHVTPRDSTDALEGAAHGAERILQYGPRAWYGVAHQLAARAYEAFLDRHLLSTQQEREEKRQQALRHYQEAMDLCLSSDLQGEMRHHVETLQQSSSPLW